MLSEKDDGYKVAYNTGSERVTLIYKWAEGGQRRSGDA